MYTATNVEISELLELSARIGADPMLTQASTGNTSIKVDGVLWIKASGKWLARAKQDDILIPVDLARAREWVRQNVDPAEKYRGVTRESRASVETAMHAALPHRVVIHVHSVHTIAWAVREDAVGQLKHRLDGVRWQWIPYVPSGLPLAQEIQKVLSCSPEFDVLVLGNHGLVLGAEDCQAAESLLHEVECRLAIPPRRNPDVDYAPLARIASSTGLHPPRDAELHALGADPVARRIVSGGLLYPCQSIFSVPSTAALFRPVPCANPAEGWEARYGERPFLLIEGAGIVVDPKMTPAAYAILRGLALVVQRIDASAPIRYLTETQIREGFDADVYRQRAEASHRSSAV
jgi:rhamnose utilization protein RhaD (predicted bifunctional aldolase and dehydrogenase)